MDYSFCADDEPDIVAMLSRFFIQNGLSGIDGCQWCGNVKAGGTAAGFDIAGY